MTTSRLHPDDNADDRTDDRTDEHADNRADDHAEDRTDDHADDRTDRDPSVDADDHHDTHEDDAAHEVENAFSTIFEKCKRSGIGVRKSNDKSEQRESDSEPSVDRSVQNVTALERTRTENVVVAAKAVILSQLSNESQVVQTAEDIISPEIQYVKCSSGDLISPEEVVVQRVEVYCAERWSDTASQLSPAPAEECTSELYYTASSDVSLLSDEQPEREAALPGHVVAGHVAAMRERFESMTRANTPCPDLPDHSPDRLP